MSSVISVAIADDHALVRGGLLAVLQADADFAVVADAGDGAELIERIAKLPQPPDVCLLDVNMPGMNGYDTLVVLRAQYPSMRFLIVTQYEHEFVIVKMLRAGASGYMLKTTPPEELKKAIREILRNPYYNNITVSGKLIGMVKKGEPYSKFVLSENEESFLRLCCSDMGYKQIADQMKKPERSIAYYRQSLFEKLGVQSRTGLALYALKLGLVQLEA